MLPFEDESSLEFLCQKNDAGLFVLANHNKKRPHNLTFGRIFDGHLLDMYEFGVEDGLKTEDWEDCDDEEEEEGVASRTRGLPVLIGERAKFGWCEPRAGVPCAS